MDFGNGAVGTVLMSFDVWFSTLPRIEVYGAEGSLLVPDPNTFGGPVMLRKPGETEWKEVELTHGFTENSRGIGLAEMAGAFEENRPHRASGDLALHVLEVMEGFHIASESGRHYDVSTRVERPAALSTNGDGLINE
jgi:predicted dehydrogenase